MNLARLGSKYRVSLGKMAHTVAPGRPFVSPSRQVNVTAPVGSRTMPRWRSYHAYSFAGSSALKKTPPRPVTRFMRLSFRAARRSHQRETEVPHAMRRRGRVASRRRGGMIRSARILTYGLRHTG